VTNTMGDLLCDLSNGDTATGDVVEVGRGGETTEILTECAFVLHQSFPVALW